MKKRAHEGTGVTEKLSNHLLVTGTVSTPECFFRRELCRRGYGPQRAEVMVLASARPWQKEGLRQCLICVAVQVRNMLQSSGRFAPAG